MFSKPFQPKTFPFWCRDGRQTRPLDIGFVFSRPLKLVVRAVLEVPVVGVFLAGPLEAPFLASHRRRCEDQRSAGLVGDSDMELP